jgi:hypothetical protein
MKLKGWYKVLLIIWLALGLPSIIIGIGFAGENIGDTFNMKGIPIEELIIFLTVWIFLLSPLILLPFGINLTFFKKNKK